MRVIAVDWSGARASSSARRAIWLAEVQGGALVRLEDRPVRALWGPERTAGDH